jgi:diguanylate cyclase (GGDEF)-like protein/PAS domain S-box-containing protein
MSFFHRAPSQPTADQSLPPLVGLFLAALLAAVLAGLVSYRYQKNALERQAREELSYLAQAQRDHLDLWLKERLDDAEATAKDPFLGAGLLDLRALQNRLQILQTVYGYHAIRILDPAARTLVTTDLDPISAEERRAALELAGSEPPRLVWSLEPVVKVSCMAPMGTGAKPSGILLFQLDIQAMLVAVLHNQPTFRASGETMLVCRQGGRMAYLGRARLATAPGTGPIAQAPGLDQDFLAGKTFSRGQDYRGVPSLAAFRQLTNLPWTVLSKMDRAESAAPLARLARVYTAVSALFLAVLGGLLYTWWLKNQAQHQASRERMEREAEEALFASEAKFRGLVNQPMVGIAIVEDGRFTFTNPRFAELFGYSADEVGELGMLDLAAAQDRPLVAEQIRRRTSGELERIEYEFQGLRKDGSQLAIEAHGSTLRLGGKLMLISMVRDVTKRKLAEEKILSLQEMLREQAIRDSLTGLYNRRFLDETMERELLLAQRHGNRISVIMADLDHFKVVNDDYGHPAGDEVLRAFSEMIALQSRRSDICCRFGGEEFLLVFPGLDKELARERADQLRRRLEANPVTFGGTGIAVTASFGVACFPQDGSTSEELIAAADRALYAAKAAGRNRVVACPLGLNDLDKTSI